MKPAVNLPLVLITVALVCLLVGFYPPATGRADNAPPYDGIALSARKIVSGHSLLIQVDSAGLQPPLTGSIQLRLEHHVYKLYPHPLKPQTAYFAIIGIAYRSTPGPEIPELVQCHRSSHPQTANYNCKRQTQNRRAESRWLPGHTESPKHRPGRKRIPPAQNDLCPLK